MQVPQQNLGRGPAERKLVHFSLKSITRSINDFSDPTETQRGKF